MTPTRPTLPESATDQRRWIPIQALRQSAYRQLGDIAAAVGRDSRLARRCREAWAGWEREAVVSILHGDFANAEVVLDRGVHALSHALELVRTDRLSEDEVVSLITAA